MKIGIHKGKGYSKHWIAYCEDKGIPFKVVDCYRSDIVQQLSDCDALMWHYRHDDYRDMLFAKQLIFSLEAAGKKVFPNSNTCWHFDDKVGQKYLLEAIGAPLVPSYVFYDKAPALKWIEETSFPKVFKLRGGAASANVKLVKSKKHARKLVRQAFGKGFPQFDRIENLKERLRKYREGKDSFLGLLKGFGRLFIPTEFARMRNNEKGYVYFQQFVPDCKFDIRVQMVGNLSYAMVRKVRNNDFRASGGGNIDYDGSTVPKSAIAIAQHIQKVLKMQTMAIDLLPYGDSYKIAEISYAFGIDEGELDFGYWDSTITWNPGKINPFGWMVELIVNSK